MIGNLTVLSKKLTGPLPRLAVFGAKIYLALVVIQFLLGFFVVILISTTDYDLSGLAALLDIGSSLKE